MRTVDGFQAAQNLTRAYTVLLLFMVGVITFQLFSGESLGIVRRREDQPRAYWTILAVQVASIAVLPYHGQARLCNFHNLTQSFYSETWPEQANSHTNFKRVLKLSL